jgi:hypothetical protein
LQLRVAPVEPRLGAFLTLVIACCLGLGGSLLFSLLALRGAPSNWWREPSAILLLTQLGLCAISMPLVLLGRRRFRRSSHFRQRLIAAGAVALVVGFSTAIIVLFD